MRAHCPNCGRGFNCDGDGECWCLKVERKFDYAEMILGGGAMGCVCPVCLTGREDLADAEEQNPAGQGTGMDRRRLGGRRRRKNTPDTQV